VLESIDKSYIDVLFRIKPQNTKEPYQDVILRNNVYIKNILEE